MLQHPSALDDLQADPEGRIALAREELLRWTSPVIYMRRTVTKPVSLGGVDLAVGDKVVMYYGAANRDPKRFENPHQLDLSREGGNVTLHSAAVIMCVLGNGLHA